LRVIAGDRIVLAVGAGDEESRAEMDEFGVEFGDEHHRVEALAATVGAACTAGCAPVWVGGTARHVGHVAAQADGWNRWGASTDRFARELAAVTEHVEEAKRDAFVPSWGGLVVLGEDEAAAEKKAIRLTAPPTALVGGPERVAERFLAYAAAGARWVVAGPVDSSDPENAAILGELVAPLVRGA
jgi:alkanesulfonate monooxygenase SsuD/methylene tetrahydromethanopterin reductase-like flavin-dependent oxidoreductase (luciferase family)